MPSRSFPRQGLQRGQGLVEKLKELIPRQQFKILFSVHRQPDIASTHQCDSQGCVGEVYNVIFEEETSEETGQSKQLKAMGKVDVPQEAFMAVEAE